MFSKKKHIGKFSFTTDNYQMKEGYNSLEIVVANLEYVSNDEMPMVITTDQRYLFEIIDENGKKRYREIFTGFVTDMEESNYFNLPYVVNVVNLIDVIPTLSRSISKYALLLVLNEINQKKNGKCK